MVGRERPQLVMGSTLTAVDGVSTVSAQIHLVAKDRLKRGVEK
jgi:hypothetical protein